MCAGLAAAEGVPGESAPPKALIGLAARRRQKSVRFETAALHCVCVFDEEKPTSAVVDSPRLILRDTALVVAADGAPATGVLPAVGGSAAAPAHAADGAAWPTAAVQPYISAAPHQTLLVRGNFALQQRCLGAVSSGGRHVGVSDVALGANGCIVVGRVLVANVAYGKHVRVRWTADAWVTFREEAAVFAASRGPLADEFSFSIGLDPLFDAAAPIVAPSAAPEPPCTSLHLEFAAVFCVEAPGGGAREFWDNNGGANYALTIARQYSQPLPTSVFDFYDWQGALQSSSAAFCKPAAPAPQPNVSPRRPPVRLERPLPAFDPFAFADVTGFTWNGFLSGYSSGCTVGSGSGAVGREAQRLACAPRSQPVGGS